MKRSLVASVALGAILSATTGAPAGAATATGVWKATLGTNGTVTMTLFDSGTGSVVLALKGLPRSATVRAVIKTGSCTTATATVATLPTYKSTSTGRLAKTRALPASAMVTAQNGDPVVVRVTAGSWTKCAVMKGGVPQAAGSFGPGTKLVGKDIKPGTYRIRVPASGCYWERLSGLGGSLSDILANDNVTGYAVVAIAETDVAFDSSRCGIWSPDLSAVTTSQSTFGEGTFIVGTDMKPGRYRSSATTSGCYWARLSGFSGDLDDIIANDNVDGSAIVDIAATDKGFTSSRCGTWTLVP